MTLLQALGAASMAFTAAFTWWACTRDPGAGQSPRSAMVEAWMGIAIGFSINFAMNMVVIPLAMGAPMTLSSNFWMGWIFTTVSLLRTYCIRRWFNARLHAAAVRLAGRARRDA